MVSTSHFQETILLVFIESQYSKETGFSPEVFFIMLLSFVQEKKQAVKINERENKYFIRQILGVKGSQR